MRLLHTLHLNELFLFCLFTTDYCTSFQIQYTVAQYRKHAKQLKNISTFRLVIYLVMNDHVLVTRKAYRAQEE